MTATATTHIIDEADALYPASLRRLARPPRALWLRGKRENLRAITKSYRKIAIVGSRAALTADCAKAKALAAEVASGGAVVVSGGALGIDAAAHAGAMAAGGATVAVLGCGIDLVYPDRHGPLFAEIARSGAVLSQFAPGTTPRRGTFVTRNATIAALADAVVLVGASLRSGALHTVAAARALEVPVAAMPGAAACDRLIDAGLALPVQDGEELDAICRGSYALQVAPASASAALVADEAAVLAAMTDQASYDEARLAAALGLGEAEVARALVSLELQQLIEPVAPAGYRRAQRRKILAIPRPAGQQTRRCYGD